MGATTIYVKVTPGATPSSMMVQMANPGDQIIWEITEGVGVLTFHPDGRPVELTRGPKFTHDASAAGTVTAGGDRRYFVCYWYEDGQNIQHDVIPMLIVDRP